MPVGSFVDKMFDEEYVAGAACCFERGGACGIRAVDGGVEGVDQICGEWEVSKAASPCEGCFGCGVVRADGGVDGCSCEDCFFDG